MVQLSEFSEKVRSHKESKESSSIFEIDIEEGEKLNDNKNTWKTLQNKKIVKQINLDNDSSL